MRMRIKTKVAGTTTTTESYAYTDDSDAPAWIATDSTWNRSVEGLTGDIEMYQTSAGMQRVLIANIRGDTVAEGSSSTANQVREIDEFGVVKNGLPSTRRYGFHGTKQREALTTGGTIAMGVRLYVPRIGRFLQVDPVLGGTESPYVYPSDPVSSSDLDGKRKNFRHRAVSYLGPKAAKRLVRVLRSKARAKRANEKYGLAFAAAAAGTAPHPALKLAGIVGGFAFAYDQNDEANTLDDYADAIEGALDDSRGRGVNIVLRWKDHRSDGFDLSDCEWLKFGIYPRGKNDPKNVRVRKDWQVD